MSKLARTLSSLFCLGALSCTEALPPEASWPPTAKKWFDRAEQSYRTGDMEDAEAAVESALRMLPDEPAVRLVAARIALARLDYDRTLQLLSGLTDEESASIRGRAYWYSGQIEKAADELERLVSNPEVRDTWATEVAKLARRGAGRTPFRISGGLVAVSEMPQVASTALVVPLEVNGEQALAMIATGTAEAVVDSSRGGEPSWLSLRFGERIEVKDVPALAKDLSGLSRQLNAPIKMLIGVNLLRRLHPTFDFSGGQFVVRSSDPPPPPEATTVRLSYVRGGGMLMRGSFGTEPNVRWASFLVDTSMTFPLALDDGGWKKAGVPLSSLRDVPNLGGLRAGMLPAMRLGAFELPDVPGVYGAPIAELEQGLDIDLDGLVGSGLLAPFRVTLVDGGRTMWLEDIPHEAMMQQRRPLPPPEPNGTLDDDEDEDDEPPKKPGTKPPAKPPAKPKAP
ncbi:MAG: hypothetical protein KF718_21105 [Polyangiaceae bacterium]|nr:hypothetical protein [Polyangiaceae bacterium]